MAFISRLPQTQMANTEGRTMTLARDIDLGSEDKDRILDMDLDDIRQITDSNELQEIIDELQVIIDHIDAQVRLREKRSTGWESAAINAAGYAKTLRTTAIQSLNKVSGRSAINAENDGRLRLAAVQKEAAKVEANKNRIEQERIAVKRKAAAQLGRAISAIEDASFHGHFFRIAKGELDKDLFDKIYSSAFEKSEDRVARCLKQNGLNGLLDFAREGGSTDND